MMQRRSQEFAKGTKQGVPSPAESRNCHPVVMGSCGANSPPPKKMSIYDGRYMHPYLRH